MGDAINQITHEFNEANPTMNFQDLPGTEQSVIADVGYPYGPAGLTRAFHGSFWRDVTNNNVSAAVQDLRAAAAAPKSFRGRLTSDADLLQSGRYPGLKAR